MLTPMAELQHAHHDADAVDIFGFWIYIMSDCILFAGLFTVYAVLHNNTYGGPSLQELTDLPYVLGETAALLLSSVTYGMTVLALYQKKLAWVMVSLGATLLLGSLFIYLELNEFVHLYLAGHSWQSSAALSAFFTLVGTHGVHVTAGLVWMLVLLGQLVKFKLSPAMARRLTYLGLFWAFLDIVWIFVYTVVYLMGVI